jgi:hypothetical protein
MTSPDTAKPATARTVNGLREEDRLGSAITSRIISPRLPRQVTQKRHDDFGACQAARAAAFMAPPRTISGARP